MKTNLVFWGFILAFVLGSCDFGTQDPQDGLINITGILTQQEFGCGHFTLIRHDSLRLHYLVVEGNDTALGIDTIARTYRLQDQPQNLHVVLHLYADTGSLCRSYCTDAICWNRPPYTTYRAREGTLTIRRTLEHLEPIFGARTYRVSAVLQDVVLEDSLGAGTFRVQRVDFDSVYVGFVMG